MKQKIIFLIILGFLINILNPMLNSVQAKEYSFNTVLFQNTDLFVSCYVFTTFKIVMNVVLEKSALPEKPKKQQKQENHPKTDCYVTNSFNTELCRQDNNRMQSSLFTFSTSNDYNSSAPVRSKVFLYFFLLLLILLSVPLPRGNIDSLILYHQIKRTPVPHRGNRGFLFKRGLNYV